MPVWPVNRHMAMPHSALSVTHNQTIAAVGSFGTLLMLWIIDWLGASLEQGQTVLSYLSLLQHHQKMLEGILDTGDISYYFILMILFVGLTIRRLDRERHP